MANIDELRQFSDDAFRQACNEADEKKAADLMRQAETAQRMALAQEKAENDEMRADESWLMAQHTTTFSVKDIVIGIAAPLATIGAALITLFGQRSQAKAVAAAEHERTEAKKEMLQLILKAQQDDIVDVSSVKALNELNKL